MTSTKLKPLQARYIEIKTKFPIDDVLIDISNLYSLFDNIELFIPGGHDEGNTRNAPFMKKYKEEDTKLNHVVSHGFISSFIKKAKEINANTIDDKEIAIRDYDHRNLFCAKDTDFDFNSGFDFTSQLVIPKERYNKLLEFYR